MSDATGGPQRRGSDALVRIRCAPATTVPSSGTFIRECYDWWRDGCNCVACRTIDSYESNASGYSTFTHRMQLLYDLARGHHGDGISLPWQQLQLFARRQS